MGWHDKTEVKAGDLGEIIIHDFLEKQGFILYRPVTNGAHKIDFFGHSGKEKAVYAFEVKTKRRRALKCDTGFNHSNFIHYEEIRKKHNINTFIFFVDVHEAKIYGQWLHKLENPKIENGIIYWGLDQMKVIRELTEYELNSISTYSRENYDYSKTPQYFKANFTQNTTAT